MTEVQKARFWSKVKVSAETSCWIWGGWVNTAGYGLYRLSGKHCPLRVHRISYELASGSAIPAGIFVCHRCDNPACVNPAHLFLGTPKDNTDDMMVKRRNMHVTKPWALARGDKNGTRTKPHTVRRGTKIEWHKLTDESVRAIRIRFFSGESAKVLAREFGVYYGTIYKVANRKTWRHIV